MHTSIKSYNTLPDAAKKIRTQVFVEEQGFCEEFDQVDAHATHFLLTVEGAAVATCRIFPHGTDGTFVMGRLAVVKQYRGSGLGHKILAFAEKEAARQGAGKMLIHSQARAQGFYAACGYLPTGENDTEEGCPHVWMAKPLLPTE